MREPSAAIAIGLIVLTAAVTFGCRETPASPSMPPEPQTLAIVSGWDQTPIGGAAVQLDGTPTTTSSTGQFTLPVGARNGMTIDVDVEGFLPHRTRLSAVPRNKVIALWPVANNAEATAIRAMVFYEDREAGVETMWRPAWWAYHLALLVDHNSRAPADVAADWMSEYPEIEALTSLPLNLTFAPKGVNTDEFDEEIIVALDRLDESCQDPWAFCPFRDPKLPYFSRQYRLAANRPDVIRRVLAFGLLKANPLPGLLNQSEPASDLSVLEKQTLRMIFLRPVGTIWPDTDPSRR
jgi:hypothetical protein